MIKENGISRLHSDVCKGYCVMVGVKGHGTLTSHQPRILRKERQGKERDKKSCQDYK